MKLVLAFSLVLVAAIFAPCDSASLPDCGENEVYETCGVIGCQLSCDMIMAGLKCVSFSLRCGNGCYCKDGFARVDNGRCVSIAECPKYTVQWQED